MQNDVSRNEEDNQSQIEALLAEDMDDDLGFDIDDNFDIDNL